MARGGGVTTLAMEQYRRRMEWHPLLTDMDMSQGWATASLATIVPQSDDLRSIFLCQVPLETEILVSESGMSIA
jgi:hypothetical protein